MFDCKSTAKIQNEEACVIMLLINLLNFIIIVTKILLTPIIKSGGKNYKIQLLNGKCIKLFSIICWVPMKFKINAGEEINIIIAQIEKLQTKLNIQ